MSAFAVVFECSNTALNPAVLERVMNRLKHRGPDGSDVFLDGSVALGHWHFWTTPEEVGERQPLKVKELPFRIVLDGRLDNRAELLTELHLNSVDGSRHSDAALVLYAYAHWGEHCFEHMIGEFALVILDERNATLICARDAMGERTLFYSLRGSQVVIASEPWAVAGADDSAVELNENGVAHYFALKATEDGQTLFEGVNELLPAHAMLFTVSDQRKWLYWQPDPSVRLRGKSDREYAEKFLSLLEESVRCRLRSTTPPGVMMSGGLDSGSIACLAARMLAPAPLTAISYVFDELTDCDERQYIEAIKTSYGIDSIQIPCDDAWPYRDWQNWPRNPNEPEKNPYRLLRERVYERAEGQRVRVLLTGEFGDHHYGAGNDWLADLILDGRLVEAVKELYLYIRYVGLRWTLQAGFLQRAARRLFLVISGGRPVRRKRNLAPDWLTSFAHDLLSISRAEPYPAFEVHAGLLGLWPSKGYSGETYYANRHALELRYPYRDRRLVEFVLSLPAYQLYRRGLYKHVLRVAMQGILPEIVRTRRQPTRLLSLFFRGMEREKTLVQQAFYNPDAIWPKYVREMWLKKHWNVVFPPEKDGPEALVPWFCFSYDSWHRSVVS